MKYVSFEGIDGAGKTTQTQIQYNHLQNKGVAVGVYSYSNKNNFWGNLIKTGYSLDQKNVLQCLFKPRIIQETLYAISARDNLRKCSLMSKQLILSDRSIVTAYASHINKIPEWFISSVEPLFVPELVLYLNIPPELGLERIKGRREKFKDEDLQSLIEFRELYMNIMFNKRPNILMNTKFIIIDGTKSLEEVTSETAELLDRLISKNDKRNE